MTNTKQAAAADDISREAAAELIYREAMLLDQHQWEEWLSLYSADAVFCYTGGLGWDVAQALAPLADKLHCADDLDLLVAQIVASARPGDQLLVMSNGGFGGIHARLIALLADARLAV